MPDFHLNGTDLIVVAIVLLSGLLAFMRGFLRETASLLAWLGGALAVYLYVFSGPETRNWAYIAKLPTSQLLIAAGIFISVVIVLSLLGHGLAKLMEHESFGFLNRILGFVYGIVRGMFAICLAYAICVWGWIPLIDRDDPPPWLNQARVFPLIDFGGYTLANLWPGVIDSIKDDPDKYLKTLDKTLPLPSPDAADHKDGAYSPQERQRMDDLVQGVEKD
jgi:membrane protein required for colicin V production